MEACGQAGDLSEEKPREFYTDWHMCQQKYKLSYLGYKINHRGDVPHPIDGVELPSRGLQTSPI